MFAISAKQPIFLFVPQEDSGMREATLLRRSSATMMIVVNQGLGFLPF